MGAVALKGRSVTHADGDYLRACIDEELRLRAAPGDAAVPLSKEVVRKGPSAKGAFLVEIDYIYRWATSRQVGLHNPAAKALPMPVTRAFAARTDRLIVTAPEPEIGPGIYIYKMTLCGIQPNEAGFLRRTVAKALTSEP